jgi:hypothetical protein
MADPGGPLDGKVKAGPESPSDPSIDNSAQYIGRGGYNQ